MNEQKVGLTTINWILSILGIIVLMCFIVLPPVFRTFLQEKPEIPEEPVTQIILTTVCRKEQINYENYVDNEIYTFKHQDNKVIEYTKEIKRIYRDPLVYQQEKHSYGELVTAFSIVNGYDYAVSPDDNEFIVNIMETYNLKTFQPTMIVIPGNTEPTPVNSEIELNDNITNTTPTLTINGYVCSSNE